MAHTIIVVPCFNEAQRLDARAFARFRESGQWVEFLFVNDGSTDDTLRVIEELRDASPDTVRAGLLEALSTEADYVGFWDADLATPLDALPRFLAVLQDRPWIDVVMGSRVKLLGRTIDRQAWRHYLGRVFATLVSLMLRVPVYDTQCGAKVFRASDTLRRVLAAPFRTSWLFDVEILARLIVMGDRGTAAVEDRVYELPLDTWRDVPGSKLTRTAYTRAAASLVTLYRVYGADLARQRRREPAAPPALRSRDVPGA